MEQIKFNPAMIGVKFSSLTVLSFDESGLKLKNGRSAEKYFCKCTCGAVKSFTKNSLINERAKNCGAPVHKRRNCQIRNDLTGKKFGFLTVLSVYPEKGKHGRTQFLCLCDCGKRIVAESNALNSGDKKSCGCLRSNFKHGEGKSGFRTKLYSWWTSSKSGKLLCPEWSDFCEVQKWFRSHGFEDVFKIKRCDKTKPFSPENCEFFEEFPPQEIKLFEFQKSVLEETKKLNKVAYYLEMGLGKTFVGSEKMMDLAADLNLVICQKSKLEDWYSHFKIFYPNVNVYRIRNKLFLNCFSENKIKKGVYIISYNKFLWSPEIENLNKEKFTLMLDESSYIQNVKSKTARYISYLKPENVILLSGTPISGKFENMWTQLRLLGWEISYKEFLKKHVKRSYKRTNTNFLAYTNFFTYKNPDGFRMEMKARGCKFMRSDEAIFLPEKMEYEIKIKTSREYQSYKENWKIKFEQNSKKIELLGENPLNKFLNLRLLCSVYSREKYEKFLDLIASTSERIVVFYNFSSELELLRTAAANRPHSIICGNYKNTENFEKFEDTILFAQYKAGAMGHNLQAANKMIFFSPPLESDLFFQAQKRIHRIGQEKHCFYYYLLCENSVETQIIKNIKMRADYTKKLFEHDFLGC